MNMRSLKAIVCGILVVLYLAGMILLIIGSVPAGISLWSISTIGGLVVLWYIRNTERNEKKEIGEETDE